MLHGLNCYNLLVGLEIPNLRISNHYTPAQDMYGYELCEENNKPETQVWYKTCTNVWPAVQTAIRKVHDLRYEISQIYEEEFPAIIPNYKVGPIKEPQQQNISTQVSRKKRFITDIIYVVPPQSWGDRSDTKHSKCLILGGRRLNQLTLIPKPKGSGGARAAMAQVGPANNRNDTKRCLPVEASLRPGEAVPW